VDLFSVAARLTSEGVGFALITVVRATRPTSGKPGDKAILTERGEWLGWVGGRCAEPTARRAAVSALADGVCRLIHLTNDETDVVRPGVEVAAMTCHSGGSLEIYVEPHLQQPSLVVFGRSPIARAVRELGTLMRYRVVAADLQPEAVRPGGLRPEALQSGPGDAERDEPEDPIPRVRELSALDALPGRRRFVVVASHGHFEVEALEWALRGRADYVGLVTSQRRLPDVLERLRERGLGSDHLAPLRAPAGLTIGATGPEEVALSVLAEIVAQRRAREQPVAPATHAATASMSSPPREPPVHEAPPPASSAPSVAAAPPEPRPEPARPVPPRQRRSCCDVDDDVPAAVTPATAATAAEPVRAAPRAPRFSAIVLAAGLSRRMGTQNKLLLPMGGQPMIRRVVENVLAAGFIEVVVVLGHEADDVRRALGSLPVRQVHNDRFESGQVSSVRAGLGALEQPVDAVMVCLGDQPLLATDDLIAAQAAYAEHAVGSILVPVRGEQRGNPVIVDWQSARDTLERGVNFGCRHFMDENPERVYRWPAPSDHFVRDVDEPGDYQTLLAGASPGRPSP
jgi:CTP:molybdopterin cytidylyltransferase MocA/xanthine/CO dehydrogenase XdhC/CoxF family maturation factor